MARKRNALVQGIVSALFLLLTIPSFAQFGSSLRGTIEDNSGAVIPNATVKLTNLGTNAARSVVSNASGYYQFGELPPGTYRIEVTAQGFKSATLDNVGVAAEAPRDVDVKLEVGGAAETVTVSGSDVPLLETADANVGGTIDTQSIQRLPTNGRDPYELLRLAPGITGDSARSGSGQAVFLPNGGGPGQSNNGIGQTENQVQISANGQRVADNNFLLDGVSVNSLGYGGAAVVTPNEEAVGQITVVSTSYSAEDGRNTGAQIKTVTKSGTNQVHGGASFLYDEPGLNAYNKYGGPVAGTAPTRINIKQRDYAASVGGPIVRDKAFFFLSFEGESLINNTFVEQFVETPEFRSFITTQRAGTIASAIVGSPGVTPRITHILQATCTSPVNLGTPCQVLPGGIDLGSPYGAPGTYVPVGQAQSGSGLDGIPDVQYAQLIQPQHSRYKQYNARGDVYLTKSDQLAGIVYFTKLDSYTPSSASDSRMMGDIPFKPLNSAGTAIWIHTFSPTLINEFRANGTRFAENGVTDSQGVVNWGIPYINIQNMAFASINDIQFGASQASTTPGILAENQYEVRDTVRKTLGTHSLAVGGEFRWEQDNNNLAGDSRPVYAFAGIWNFANDTPIYEGIDANPNTGGIPNARRYWRDHYIGVFGQHDWKVTPNLTINTGLRWEYFEPLYNKGSLVNYPVLGTGAGNELIGASLVPRNHLWQTEHRDFSPKFGFAWTPPSQEGKMVVRGGFAMAYNRLSDALFDPGTEDGPNFLNFGICCGTAATDFGTPYAKGAIQYQLGSSTSPFSYAPNAALAVGVNSRGLPNNFQGNPLTIEVYGALPKTPTPYSYLYSMEVQRELPGQMVATVGYQGSTGRHYTRLVNQLFLYANGSATGSTPFTGAYFAQNDSNQYYNALNLNLEKRFAHGYSLNAVYTFSKAMDQITNGDEANANANQTDPAHNDTELGPSDYDAKHRITVSGLWDIPGTKGGNSILKAVTNGWQINGIYTFHTGFPFTPVTYQLHGVPTVESAGVIGPVRPLSYNGGFNTSCSNDPFINGSDVANRGAAGNGANAFDIVPPTGSNGTPPGIGRNSFRGPCYMDTDMSFAKEQKLPWIGDAGMLRFQANFYNLFNKLNLTPFTNGNGNTSALIESPNFGKAQSADAGRVIEFTARLRF
jgi:hypothetical protein